MDQIQSSVEALRFICLSKGLLKASARIVPTCCWLCPQMIKSLHWISCLGSFIDAAVNPNTGKVTALCLSSQILTMCSGLWSAEMHRLTPYCRCSQKVEELIPVVRVAWLRLYEQAAGGMRVSSVEGSHNLSPVTMCSFFSKKGKDDHVAEGPLVTLFFGPGLRGCTNGLCFCCSLSDIHSSIFFMPLPYSCGPLQLKSVLCQIDMEECINS